MYTYDILALLQMLILGFRLMWWLVTDFKCNWWVPWLKVKEIERSLQMNKKHALGSSEIRGWSFMQLMVRSLPQRFEVKELPFAGHIIGYHNFIVCGCIFEMSRSF